MWGESRWRTFARWVGIVVACDLVVGGAAIALSTIRHDFTRQTAAEALCWSALAPLVVLLLAYWQRTGIREVYSLPRPSLAPTVDLEAAVRARRRADEVELTILCIVVAASLAAVGVILGAGR
jgi:H+/Cl- antiporter ClcA